MPLPRFQRVELLPARFRRRRFRPAFAVAIALCGADAHARSPADFAVEADYLARFAPFVEWPEATFDNATAPLVICIAGADPLGPRIDALTREQPVNGHPIQIRHVDAIEPGMRCQILYTTGEQSEESLRRIAREPVLTVTDDSPGGIIRFVLQAGRIRFTIDQAAAQDANLVISSKLLGLALQVSR